MKKPYKMFLYKTYTNLTIQLKPSKPSIITAIALKKKRSNPSQPRDKQIRKYTSLRFLNINTILTSFTFLLITRNPSQIPLSP